MMFRSPSSPNRLLALVLALVGLSSLAAAGYLTATQGSYTVYDGDRVIPVTGSYQTVGEVLAAAGVSLRPEDNVIPDVREPADPSTAVQIQRAQAVTLRTEEDGSRTLWTQHSTLGAFLTEAGVMPRRTDQVFADRALVPFNALDQTPLPSEVEIGRFLTVTIQDGGDKRVLRTAAQTVGDALQEANITLYAADGVEPSPGTWLTPEMVIRVQRSFPLSIHVDGRITQTRSHHTNVMDVLAEAGIGLVGYDYTQPGPDAVLRPNDTIHVIRVSEDFRIEDTPLPFQTVWQASDELELDTKAVLRAGEPGTLRQRIRVRYENGVETSQEVDGEWIVREPVNEIMGYGTRVNVRVVETPEGPLEYWRVVRMRVTSYTAGSSGKPPEHPAYGVTASGALASKGIVAVDRNVVPFRSYVYVPGYGVGYAGDTGGGVRGRWIDLGYDEGNYRSWSGYVDVYYLTPVPAPEDINYLLPSALP